MIEELILPYVKNGVVKVGGVKGVRLIKHENAEIEFYLDLETSDSGTYLAKVNFKLSNGVEKRKTVYDMIVRHDGIIIKGFGKQKISYKGYIVANEDTHLGVFLYLKSYADNLLTDELSEENEVIKVLFQDGGLFDRGNVKIKYTILTRKTYEDTPAKQVHFTEIFKIIFNEKYGKGIVDKELEEVFDNLPFSKKLAPAVEFAQAYYPDVKSSTKPLDVLTKFLWDRLEEDKSFDLLKVTKKDIEGYIRKSKDCSRSTIEGFQSKIKAFCAYYGLNVLPDFKALKREVLANETVKEVSVSHVEKVIEILKINYLSRIKTSVAELIKATKMERDRKLLFYKNYVMIEKRNYAIFLLVVNHGLHPSELHALKVNSLKANTLFVKGRVKMVKDSTKKLDDEIKALSLQIKNKVNLSTKEILREKKKQLQNELTLRKAEVQNKRGSIVLKDEVKEAINDYLETIQSLFDEENKADQPMFISKREHYNRFETDNLELSFVKALSQESFKFAFTYKSEALIEKAVKSKETSTIIDDILKSSKNSKLLCTIEEVLRYRVYKEVKNILLTEENPSIEKVVNNLKEYDKSTLVKGFYKSIIEEQETNKRRAENEIGQDEIMFIDGRGTSAESNERFTFKVKKI
ncbi:hypothetical protein [Lysinibacillus xylanilyticus]|uniref:Uncharacterized protein n=1 Tax=Lysinibacillus xylanilyticus TaxID=582475 RepID=A0ABV3W026_9BACI